MKKYSSEINSNKLAWAYHITFRTYNTWNHGDERGSIDRVHNIFGTPKIKPNSLLHRAMKFKALESEFILNPSQRETTLKSIINTCKYNDWNLFAVHVRTNHIHVILQAKVMATTVMGKLKCYATKDLKKFHFELSQRNAFWARHGSTKNIWVPEEIFKELYYVVKNQGDLMALYYDKKFYNAFDEKLYEMYFDK